MIVVTGGEGFIGKNLVKELQKRGYTEVIPLDTKHETLEEIYDFLHINAHQINCVFHLGGITDTTEMDRNKLDEYNVNSSIFIWYLCEAYKIPLVYASSDATYGDGSLGFDDDNEIVGLKPLSPYGWSKHQFDVWAGIQDKHPPFWYGLKFFTVYGSDESHKGKMASIIYQSYNQIREFGKIKLFKSHNPIYKNGEQMRDFIYVDDIVDVCIWMYENKPESGFYNVGTGKARTFNDMAAAVFRYLNIETLKNITYVDMPGKLKDKYQYFTEAKIDKLRNAGYNKPFTELEDGVIKYLMQ
jgi:ADP-L-glycero-D-manno-heptose 6-epimerase